jgi:hypothetical protein
VFVSAAGSGSSGPAGTKRYSSLGSPSDITISHNSPSLSRFFHKGRWKREKVKVAREKGAGGDPGFDGCLAALGAKVEPEKISSEISY